MKNIAFGGIDLSCVMDNKVYITKEKQFFYNGLLDSLALFSCEKDYFESLISPTFSPLFELETEFDYAFMPIVFKNSCEFGKINQTLKVRLVDFQKRVNELPKELWEWEELYSNKKWLEIRQESKNILKKLGEENRKFGVS
jgi:hypothetical protein